ncbi:MAG: helix-turn-helix domain-containing protein [Pseudobdellovibrio sp.]
MKNLLEPKEVCKILNIKKSRLYSMVFYRQIPFIKINTSLRFDPDEIQKWIDEQAKKIKGKL